MASSTKKNFVVTKANGETVTVAGTRAEESGERSQVKIYDGDDIVASFRGYTDFYIETSSAT